MSTGAAGPASRLGAIKTKTDLIFETLLEDILTGRRIPNERLSVDAIAREYGISKVPVREAIQRLEAQRLVTLTPHVGASVAPLNHREMRGVFIARQVLEAAAAELAAGRITQAELDELDHAQGELREAVRRGDVSELSQANARFHLTLARASGYSIFAELTELLLQSVWRYRSEVPMDLANWKQVIQEHSAILEALRRKDREATGALAAAHLCSQALHESPLSSGSVDEEV